LRFHAVREHKAWNIMLWKTGSPENGRGFLFSEAGLDGI
jgi:hypothetical protein